MHLESHTVTAALRSSKAFIISCYYKSISCKEGGAITSVMLQRAEHMSEMEGWLQYCQTNSFCHALPYLSLASYEEAVTYKLAIFYLQNTRKKLRFIGGAVGEGACKCVDFTICKLIKLKETHPIREVDIAGW